MSRPRATDALLTLAAVGLASELIYFLVFVRPFPLARFYNTIPPVDYAKLTHHSVGGAASYTLSILALFTGYAIVLRTLSAIPRDSASSRWAWGLVVGGATLFGATLAMAYPTTAIDVLIYAVRTRGWAIHGLNPLATAPQDLLGDPWVGLAAEWADAPSPYGLVWEGTSLLAFRLVGGNLLAHLFALKTITTLAHLSCVALIGLTLRRLKPDWALTASAAFAWNPLALLESAGNGHNDILMVFFLLLAVYFVAGNRRWLVGLALSFSILTKFIPVIAVPFFLLYLARRESSWWRRFAVAAGNLALIGGLGVALMTPVWPGWENWAVRNLGHGAGKSPFALLVLILRPWLGTNLAFDIGRYLMGALFLIICLWLAWRAFTGPPTVAHVILVPSFGVFFWYLVLPNQQFHAWYLLWPLGVAALLVPSSAFTRVAAFGLTALLSITLYETMRVWWWNILNPLALHTIAIPFVFGLPMLAGIKGESLLWPGVNSSKPPTQ